MSRTYVVIAESPAAGRKIVDDYRRMAPHISGVTFVMITAPSFELERKLGADRIIELLDDHLHSQHTRTPQSWLFLTSIVLIQYADAEHYYVFRDQRGCSDAIHKIGDPIPPAIAEHHRQLLNRPNPLGPQEPRSFVVPIGTPPLSPDSVFENTEDFLLNVCSMNVNFKDWLLGVYANLLSYKTQACMDFKSIHKDEHLALTITCLREMVATGPLTMTQVPGSETAFLFERKSMNEHPGT